MSKFYKYLKLLEGGSYGHLANLFDNVNFTFGDLKDAIKDSLSGNLEYVRLKTDGQNIMFTWKDGQILFARNKGHLKNFGANALTTQQLADKFKGRDTLEQAYNSAAIDLYNAITKLTEKQRDKIFNQGKKWMSAEVMYTENENIVHYGTNELRFHGTKEYDADGNEIGDYKEDNRILAGMIKQVKQDKQGTYEIKSLEKADLPKIPDFDDQVKRLTGKLEKIKKRFRLSDNHTILDYKRAYFKDLMKRKNIPENKYLLKRWSEFDKKAYTMKQAKSDLPDDIFQKVKDIENDIQTYVKDCILPLEKLILDLGATVLSNVSNFMVLHPDKSKAQMKSKLEGAIKQIRQKGGPKMIKKLEMELDRLQAAGGVDNIFPEEGITFIYKGGFYKLTGIFAPTNQIINLLWQLE